VWFVSFDNKPPDKLENCSLQVSCIKSSDVRKRKEQRPFRSCSLYTLVSIHTIKILFLLCGHRSTGHHKLRIDCFRLFVFQTECQSQSSLHGAYLFFVEKKTPCSVEFIAQLFMQFPTPCYRVFSDPINSGKSWQQNPEPSGNYCLFRCSQKHLSSNTRHVIWRCRTRCK